MINEKRKIMKAKLKIAEIKYPKVYSKYSRNIMLLYYDILNKTSNNIWWLCINIILQYLHLLNFGLNQNVSLLNFYAYLVQKYFKSKQIIRKIKKYNSIY